MASGGESPHPSTCLWVDARWSIQSIARVGLGGASNSLPMQRIRGFALPTGRPSEMLSAACVLSAAVLLLFVRRQRRLSSREHHREHPRSTVIRAVFSSDRKHVKPTSATEPVCRNQCNNSPRRTVVTEADEWGPADIQDTPLQIADGGIHGPEEARGTRPACAFARLGATCAHAPCMHEPCIIPESIMLPPPRRAGRRRQRIEARGSRRSQQCERGPPGRSR